MTRSETWLEEHASMSYQTLLEQQIERKLCRALQVQTDKETKKKPEVTGRNTAREKKIFASFITYSNISKPTPQSNEGCA
mmetsp:Transcript_15432/g.22603  ORF Transcript_15432/g.22603 Transcript_15432/m.22603 type:complete len:80 (+) Transcript_15432:758-997(+)